MKKPELLSPVGNMECLIAAIQGGCDAVYLGGYAFGARSFAGNFSNEELVEAISYAHIYGVKVYVTVNTLIYEDEVDRFLEYIDFLHKNNVDAVIIQDLGMLDLVRMMYPKLEVHASTQMHIHNLEGVQFLEQLGVKRVVLARETDWKHIQKIKENSQVELEIFVHGALCICYSGQCLMSSMIGGRSGNRGTCTQCCRMPYHLNGKESYVLSPKDLNSLEHLGILMDIGVDSFKIEGRMKRPEYVYFVTHLYRQAIDEYIAKKTITIDPKQIVILKKLFNREFTKGFLFFEDSKKFMNHKRPNHIGIEIGKVVSYQNGFVTCKLTDAVRQNDGIRILNNKKDCGCILNKIYQNKKLVNGGSKGDTISFAIDTPVQVGDSLLKTSDFEDLEWIQKQIHGNARKIPIQGKLIGKIGEPFTLMLTDSKNNVTIKGNFLIEKAVNTEVSPDRIQSQLSKMGGTLYQLVTLEMSLDPHIFVPIQELNQLRRNAIQQLTEQRKYKLPYQKQEYHKEVPEWIEEDGYTVQIESFEQYLKIKDQNWKNIYIEEETLYENLEDTRKVFHASRVQENLKIQKNPLLAGELSNIVWNHAWYSDFSLNVTNSYTVAFLHALGVKRITLSYELTDKQVSDIIIAYQNRYHKYPNLERIISSYPEVMISKWNIEQEYSLKAKDFKMKDSKNNQFFFRNRNGKTQIYLRKKIQLNDKNQFQLGIHTLRISLIDSV